MRHCIVYVFTIVLMVTTGSVAGQNNPATNNPINIGQPLAYRAGFAANLPFVGANTDTFKGRAGWGLWGEVEFKLTRSWRLHPQLAYNNFGFNQYFYNDSGARLRRTIRENYFEPQFVFSFLPGHDANSSRFTLGIGGSFLINRKTDQPDVLGINITQKTLDNKKSFSAGLLLSAGFMAPMGNRVDFGIQYTQGLPAKIYPLDITGRTGTLQVKLGLRINVENETKIKTNADPLPEKAAYKPDSLILIVRLKENVKRIAALVQGGYVEDANKMREDTRFENQTIKTAFDSRFTLLRVFYIYDTDSKTALAGNFKGILLNASLERDSSIRLPHQQYLFAEFARQFDEVSQTSGMYGLVIYTDRFKNIPPPFPSFVSNYYGIFSKDEVVARFEKRLKKYYEQDRQ